MKMENGSGEDCSVKVAVHARPLIGDEQIQGCKDCITVIPKKPQVQIGTHSFTFDYVYGSTASPPSSMFEECVAPLVDGLFQGYNATVLAYGQTGSGKTYTMGTANKDGSPIGLIPQVMTMLFRKIENLKLQAEFQLHVSFIEILKEEVRDLLDMGCPGKSEPSSNGHSGKLAMSGKPQVQIRESSNGVITLTGSTEIDVQTQKEMFTCLEQGSFNRATGSTNMNNQSSRSHAIFTITLDQVRKLDRVSSTDGIPTEDMVEDYLCAKLHLVDLAGSERAKRTGSDGLRFKEGVHINKGLLALGNVISALGDNKKRKEGQHVPYRDSKLTRLLQDSLGGNSRTVMIACISPADINAEETLNTLKYANRARNIQNKPVVNRDPLSNELQRMRQQLEYLQAELLCARGRCPSDEVRVLKERISWLEVTNEDLCQQLNEYRGRSSITKDYGSDSKGSPLFLKEVIRRNLSNVSFLDFQTSEDNGDDDSKEIDEETSKEWEHTALQDSLGKELNELNKQLEQKESEMKIFGGLDALALKQHFGKKLIELEDEKRNVQRERDRLSEIENRATITDGKTPRSSDTHFQKLKSLEAQILDLKKKQENQVQLLKQKQKSDEAAKKLQEEIQFIKAQKVRLQNKIKQEAEQFRQWKACREKELLQLRKEGRRNEYERHKLQALNQRQKLILQRKTEEAAMATKRLKDLLEARKPSGRESGASMNGNYLSIQGNDKSLQRWIDHELEVMVNVHEVRCEYEKQTQLRATLAEELAILKKTEDTTCNNLSPPNGKSGHGMRSSMSQDARYARIISLENMISISSNILVAMASQLSEAEEHERSFSGRGRWNQLRSLGDARNILQYIFNISVHARCQSREKGIEMKDLKVQINELVTLLKHSEACRKKAEMELKDKDQTVSNDVVAFTMVSPGNSNGSLKHGADETCTPLSPLTPPAQKQLKYSPGIANSPNTEIVKFMKTQKMVPMCQVPMGKKLSIGRYSGRLWRWKRSHHQWHLQFKWKWQKPWKLSEWIRHSDQTIMRAKPRHHQLLHRTA
ncbi:Kinesin-like protein [Zostera marina]|uniref:Kinesin-like protein n=1 Tax=Zostera marina TaxID=29655 RepID=A0A0K9PL76_ZOSMR|nr:Kinesin-like protein [Zostera marina]